MPRLCSILLLSLWIGSAASAAIVLGPQPSYVAASADDAVGFDAENSIAPAGALPTTGEVSAIDGATTTSVAFDLSNPRFGIVLEFERDATANASTYGSAYILFTSDSPVDYVLSGTFSTDDPDGRRVNFAAGLYDLTATSGGFGTTLFYADYFSSQTPSETFTLGQPGGDLSYYGAQGSLTGTLIAGHQYQLVVNGGIATGALAGSYPATASGTVALNFVPEPASGLLVLAGLLGLAVQRRVRA
jgi:hypothetical protein